MQRVSVLLLTVALLFATSIPSYSAKIDSSSLNLADIVSSKSSGVGIPIGSVIPWPADTMPAEGEWLECNGQAYNTSTYSELYAAIKTANVPDYRGVFLRGNDDGKGYDPGRVVGSYQEDKLAKHEVGGIYRETGELPASEANGSLQVEYLTDTIGDAPVTLSIGEGDDTRPANVSTRYLIRAR